MPELTANDLQGLFDAFNRHDIDGVMSYFADDIVFDTVAGSAAHGTRIEGSAAVREAFSNVWGTMPDVQWANSKHFTAGDRGVSEWTFVATQADGKRIEADGVDLFTIRDGKIVRKQAFRKNRPLLDPA